MRSTIAPEISAAVMTAKVPWNAMNSTWGIVPCGSSVTPRSRLKFRPPDERRAGGERQRVPEEGPGHAREAQRDETHHHRVERVLGPDEPAVEEGKGGGHQQHERRGHQHPRHICVVHRSSGRRRRAGRDFVPRACRVRSREYLARSVLAARAAGHMPVHNLLISRRLRAATDCGANSRSDILVGTSG